MDIDATSGQKRPHGQAFPNGSGAEHHEPDKKRSSLCAAQEKFARPASNGQQQAGTHASNALMRKLFNKNAPQTRKKYSPFCDMDVRFLRFTAVMPSRPRFNGTGKGFLVQTIMLPYTLPSQIQVGPEVACVSPEDPDIVRLAKYYLKEDPSKPNAPGRYLLCGDEQYHECALGQALDFKMFLSAKPTEPAIDSPDYPMQPFTIVSIEQVKTVDKEGRHGQMEVGFKFKDSRLISSPQLCSQNENPCDDQVGEVYQLCPPGTNYYVNLTERPPEGKSKAKDAAPKAVDPNDPAAVALAELEANDPQTPPATEDSSMGDEAMVTNTTDTPQPVEEGESDPATDDLFADPGSVPVADGAAGQGGPIELSIYDWLPTLPPLVQATHNRTIIWAETTLPVLNDDRGTIYTQVMYDTSKWTKSFKLVDPADPTKFIEKVLPALEVAIYGTQWKVQQGTGPLQPSNFLLRISAGARVAPHILGTGNINTWKLLAPGHLNPDLRSRLGISCKGSLKESYALQSEISSAVKLRTENGVDTVVQYKADHVLFALEEHLAKYAWPISRKTAMALIVKKYRNAKGAFVPANAVGDRDESKHVLNHMKFYHRHVTNLMETDKEVMVGMPVVPDDQNQYYVLTPVPYTAEVSNKALEIEPSIHATGLLDKAFEGRMENELGDLTGINAVDDEMRNDSFVVFSIDGTVAQAAKKRFEDRLLDYEKACKMYESDAADAEAEAGDEEEAGEVAEEEE